LTQNKTLTILNISDNQISDDGVKAICMSLLSNGSLKVLKLDSNKIGDPGAKYVSDLLRRQPHIHISLGFNKIGDVGCQDLYEAKQECPSIQLDLSGNMDISTRMFELMKSGDKFSY